MTSPFEEFDPLRATLPASLESERLLLRCYQIADVPSIVGMLDGNRDRLRNDFPGRVQAVHSRSDVEAFVWHVRRLWDVREAFHFSIWEKQSQAYVGEVFITGISWRVPKGDVAYFVVKECERKGMMTEAVKTLLPFAFDTLQMNKLQIRCAVDNLRSQRVAELCGFKIEGVLRNDFVKGDGQMPIDLVYYGMTPGDYRKAFRFPPQTGGFP